MAPLAPLVPLIVAGGIVTEAVGTYQAGVMASAEANAQAKVAEYNARVAEQQAKQEEQAALFAQKKQAEEASRYGSTLQANLAASGAVSTEGTPLMIQARQAAESELDNLLIGYEGQIRSGRATSEAAIQRAQGSIYKQRAGSAMTAGMFGAGSSLLTGFGKMYS